MSFLEDFFKDYEKILALAFVFITLGYIVVIRFYMSKIQAVIDNVSLDDKREYTFQRAGAVFLKRINTLFIPSIILIYYAFFVTYTTFQGNGDTFDIMRVINPLNNNSRGVSSSITPPIIGLLFMAFSVSIMFIAHIAIITTKAFLYTKTLSQTLAYILDIFKYVLILGLIGGGLSKIPSVFSLINNKTSSVLPILLIKYFTALIFYIPCMVTNTIADTSQVGRNTPKHVLIVFLIQCGLIVLNVFIPIIDRYLTKHYVNTILEGPIYLSNEYNYSDTDIKFIDISGCVKSHIDDEYDCVVKLMDKEDVTNKIQEDNINLYFPGKTKREIDEATGSLSDDPNTYKEKSRYDYNYSYSFWFYINSTTGENVELPMIDFAKNPEVKYNPHLNQVKIYYNEDSESVTLNHIKLQKWNHLVINYTSGHLDIFINGDLATTKTNIKLNIGYMKPITSGQYNGINGRIANVVYYHKPLSKILIDYLYNQGKNKDVPKGGGILSTLWIKAFNDGEQRSFENITDGIVTIMTTVLPRPRSLERTYKYFENLPHNLYIDTRTLIDKYIFMFDTTIENEDNKLEEKYKITKQLV
tara:strand:+ start:280 stop:2031 length:1752 start_codon:yes stop_codon:yes gene_type:complete